MPSATSRLSGSVRFRRPEKYSILFKALLRDFRWILVNLIYTGKFQGPVLMLSFTERMNDEAIEIFADHPHFDSYRHQLKVVLALSDVADHSGPTEFAAKSPKFHFRYWREYFSSWLSEHGYIEDKTKTISIDYFLKFGTAKKAVISAGDIFLFDSRHLHRASELTQGNREILWFYF